MNKVNENELFRHLSEFLKAKGIQLQEGSYTKTIQQGCGLLADTVNLSQQALERARTEMEKNLEKMREVIHQQTAPKGTRAQPGKKSAKAKTTSARRKGTR